MNTDSKQERCTYHFPSGRRCRQSVAPDNLQFCATHARRTSEVAPHPEAASSPYDPAPASQLLDAAGELTSADDVNRVLRAVYRAMVERRLSLKETGVLCYLAQTILHTNRVSAYEQKLQAEVAAKRRDWDLINDLPMAIRD